MSSTATTAPVAPVLVAHAGCTPGTPCSLSVGLLEAGNSHHCASTSGVAVPPSNRGSFGVGVVAGSAIGNNVEANAAAPQSVPVQRCRTVNAYESRVVGYDVVYEYNGQRYTTQLPSDPGPRLAIDVRPTAGAPLDRVGPPVSHGAVPPATYAQTAPSYSEVPPAYYDAAPAYYDASPGYYAPAPVYYSAPYSAPYYVAPAAIGLGIGYWVGRTWHAGHRNGWHGHRGWH